MSVPALLVTGFLGAGKTTFINDLLQDSRGRRIAAIVNDFGSINIDAALLESASDEVIGLRNGCICCSLQGDLLRTLKQVLGTNTPDLIVIEASGVAEPTGIMDGLLDPVLWNSVCLDSVVCILDAEDVTRMPARVEDALWRAQVAAADVIQLTKVDTLEPDALAGLAGRLAAMGKGAVFGADGSNRSLNELLGLATGTRPVPETALVHDSSRFVTLAWRCDGPVLMAEFQRAIGGLSPTLLRAKGFVAFIEKPGQQFVFQLVGQRATLASHERTSSGCELVLIGERDQFDPGTAVRLLDALPKFPHDSPVQPADNSDQLG